MVFYNILPRFICVFGVTFMSQQQHHSAVPSVPVHSSPPLTALTTVYGGPQYVPMTEEVMSSTQALTQTPAKVVSDSYTAMSLKLGSQATEVVRGAHLCYLETCRMFNRIFLAVSDGTHYILKNSNPLSPMHIGFNDSEVTRALSYVGRVLPVNPDNGHLPIMHADLTATIDSGADHVASVREIVYVVMSMFALIHRRLMLAYLNPDPDTFPDTMRGITVSLRAVFRIVAMHLGYRANQCPVLSRWINVTQPFYLMPGDVMVMFNELFYSARRFDAINFGDPTGTLKRNIARESLGYYSRLIHDNFYGQSVPKVSLTSTTSPIEPSNAVAMEILPQKTTMSDDYSPLTEPPIMDESTTTTSAAKQEATSSSTKCQFITGNYHVVDDLSGGY